jgi:molecular chaperone GrpE
MAPEQPAAERPARSEPVVAEKANQGNANQEKAEQEKDSPAIRELTDRLLRALADLDNMRKRHTRELRDLCAAERDRVAAAWLPVLDNLDRALEHGHSDTDAVLAGVVAVRDQAVRLLAELGYPRHAEVGVPFDPARHEVVAVVDDARTPPGSVVEVVRPGYGDVTRQLRPAAVAVSRRPD